jgi:peptidoglycan/xylan/chitin deacetylase (PgdA/CDA1 family)
MLNKMKQKLLNVVAFISFYLGVINFFYWLNRKSKRVLTFHNVLPDALWNPIANGVSNKESDFRRIILEIRRKFRFSNDVLDPRTITLTFDDGYLNQYEIAGAILEEFKIPAILFVSGDIINAKHANQALVVDQLLHWGGFAPNTLPYSQFWSNWLRPKFASDSQTKGRSVLEDVNLTYSLEKIFRGLSPEYLRLRMTGITESQLNDLRSRGWLIGWHTKSHFPLSSLTDEEVRNEVMPPSEFIGIPFSYPYGELKSVDERVVEIVKQCGYPYAFSNVINGGGLSGKFFLPRMSVSSNKYRLHFCLSGMEYFIRSMKLLPIVNI